MWGVLLLYAASGSHRTAPFWPETCLPHRDPGAILALTQGILPSPAGRFLSPGCAFQGPQGVVPVPAQGGLCLHSCVTPGTAPAPTLGISVPLTLTWVLHHCQDLGAAPPLILGGGLPLPPQHGDHPCPETRDYCHLTLNPVLQPLWDSQEWPLYPLPKGFLPPKSMSQGSQRLLRP